MTRAFLCLLIASSLQAADLRPFILDHRQADRSSLDLSFLLDAPAGKRGFVKVSNGHLATADGKRLRLWGVNVTDWSKGSVMLPPKEDAPMWAATLARFGVNCVRLHFLDLPAPRGLIDPNRDDTRSFDAQQLDRLDFWFAELKKRGIYTNLNLNVGRSYKPGDGVEAAEKIRWAKGLTLYNKRLIELQKEYARMLLTHRNPYTGIEYRHDPAIAIVELVNENALYLGFRAPTPAYEKELLDLYNEWLAANLSKDELDRLRAAAGVPAGEPVPRLSGRDVAAATKERFHTEMRFFVEMESRFFRDMAGFLRNDLGIRAPVLATADHAHNGSSYPLVASTSLLDIVDGHTYWQHPGSRPKQNTPMVNDPLESTVVELSRTAVAGKPYTVSEVNHPYPNEYGAEGIPILAAYGALHDWDGIFWYTFEPKQKDWKPYVGDPFDISLDPVKMSQLAAGALMFLRGDVAAARGTVERSYSREQVYDSTRLPRTEKPYFTPGFPLSVPLRHSVRIRSFDGGPAARHDTLADPPIVSDTGELAWHKSDSGGLVTLDAARAQARIGFSKTPAPTLKHLSASLDNRFASLLLTPLDNQPVARSSRLLLTAGSTVANTGAEWNDTRTNLKQWGGTPTLIENVTGKVTLRNLASARDVSVIALDGSGRPLGSPAAATRSADGWEFPLGAQVTTWYEIRVKR